MLSDEEGTVCTVRGSSRFVMDTYRYTYEQWTTQVTDAIMRPILRWSKFFKDTLPDKVPKETDEYMTMEYMDYYSCVGTDVRTSSQTFECTGYQPDWKGRGNEGISDGYPRFGARTREQFGVFYGANDMVKPEYIRLNLELGATTLLASCTAVVALLF